MSDLPNIWRMQAQFDVNGLIEALAHNDSGIRKRAAAALRTLDAVEAVPALKKALSAEQIPDTRSAITAALEYLLPEEADILPKMLAQLKSAESDAIIRAARSLGDLKDKTAVEPLVLVFYNTTLPGRVRLAAAEALLKLESAPAVVTLLAGLRGKDWHIRRNSIAVLGQLRADWAADAIASCLRDENEIVRRTARAALKRIGTPEALRAVESIQEPQVPVNPKAKTARLAATEPIKPATLEEVLKERAANSPADTTSDSSSDSATPL